MNNPHELQTNAPGKVEVTGTEIPANVPTVVDATELLSEVEALGTAMRMLIVKAKRVQHTDRFDPHEDSGRSLALAQSHLQTGFMWLRRAIKPLKGF